jgi:hypothetical protein
MQEPTPIQTGRHWLRFGIADFISVAVTCFIGLAAGYVAIVSGVHGGSPWPTVILSAPAFIPAILVCGDTVGYAYSIIGGTAALFAVYAAVVRRRGSVAIYYVLAFHALCIVAATLYVLASSF